VNENKFYNRIFFFIIPSFVCDGYVKCCDILPVFQQLSSGLYVSYLLCYCLDYLQAKLLYC